MSSSILQQLKHSGHLVQTRSPAYEEREKQSLVRLQGLPARTYLQNYDLLFRYVSRWLLNREYELTGKQPHQVLARVCEQFASRTQIEEMIRCRHELKYHDVPVSESAMQVMQSLLQHLRSKDTYFTPETPIRRA
jgi:hypothetical protein